MHSLCETLLISVYQIRVVYYCLFKNIFIKKSLKLYISDIKHIKSEVRRELKFKKYNVIILYKK